MGRTGNYCVKQNKPDLGNKYVGPDFLKQNYLGKGRRPVGGGGRRNKRKWLGVNIIKAYFRPE
jgi:hypothetical protein